jgi:hypothetical protein
VTGANVSREVLGYGLCDSGFSNQKLALLGLFAKALERSSSITIPRLANFATSNAGPVSILEFEEVFDIPLLRKFGDEIGVEVRDGHETERVSYHETFALGLQTSSSGLSDIQSLSAKFWRALRPVAPLSQKVECLADEIFSKHGTQAVVQLRIEPDWQRFVSTVLHSRGQDVMPTTYSGILQRVSAMLPEVKKILVTCDETQVPVYEIERYAESALGITVLSKGRLLGSTLKPDQYFVRSIIDFELGLQSNIFVGAPHSTFADTMYSTKMAMQPNSEWTHYTYKLESDLLVTRHLN